MKKALFPPFVLLTVVCFGQENSIAEDKHEIKANAFNLILFKSPELSYEYLINSESSLGVSIMINLENPEDGSYIDGPYYYEEFAFTPYYRRFISKGYARGFFFEAFGMYNIQGDFDGIWGSNYDDITYTDDTSHNLAFGISLGSKFVSKGGFVFEFFAGVGRNIVISDDDLANEFVPRAGISLGYRF